jgi:hypothetical protein
LRPAGAFVGRKRGSEPAAADVLRFGHADTDKSVKNQCFVHRLSCAEAAVLVASFAAVPIGFLTLAVRLHLLDKA